MKILGVHHYEASHAQMEEAIEIQWGPDLSVEDLAEARAKVQEHFGNLYLIEIASDNPLPEEFDWGSLTQEVMGEPKENWQAPYDERQLDTEGKRWAFFFHFLDSKRPLLTPNGKLVLPTPSPMPRHLADIKYELP